MLGTILGVGHEDGRELHKAVLKFVHVHWFFGFHAVFNLSNGNGLEEGQSVSEHTDRYVAAEQSW